MSETQTATAEIVRHPELAQSRGAIAVRTEQPIQITDSPLIAAIARVMSAVGSVEKDGHNQFHNYKYTSAAAIANALQKLMAENGLVIVQRERDVQYMEAMGTLAIKYDFDVMHVSGFSLPPVQHTGMSAAKNSKGGFDDKASNKCHTAARKYFLLGLFHIPSGDFPDADAHEDAGPEKSRVQKHRDQKTEPNRQPPHGDGASEPATFELVTGDGEIVTHTKLAAYIDGLKLAISGAQDPGAVWSDNAKAFGDILARAKVKGATKAVLALEACEAEINTMLLPK